MGSCFPTDFRVLICFQSRKAHRVHVRNKDLFRYLGCFIAIVVGYLVAWTAVSLDYTLLRHFAGIQTPATTSATAVASQTDPVGFNDMLVKGRISKVVELSTSNLNVNATPPTTTTSTTMTTAKMNGSASATQYQYFRVCRAMSWDVAVQLGELDDL